MTWWQNMCEHQSPFILVGQGADRIKKESSSTKVLLAMQHSRPKGLSLISDLPISFSFVLSVD
jgi:hypothetical protein